MALVVMYFKCVKGKLGTVREKPEPLGVLLRQPG
jgi:hypothetical protein